MNCDCIGRIKERFLKENPTWKGREVVEITDDPSSMLVFEGNTAVFRKFHTFEVTVKGIKKKYEVPILWKICPFCGTSTDPNYKPASYFVIECKCGCGSLLAGYETRSIDALDKLAILDHVHNGHVLKITGKAPSMSRCKKLKEVKK